MAILSEKRQKCFGLRRKDVRMRAIICDDDGRFAKKLEQLIMQYYRNMGIVRDSIPAFSASKTWVSPTSVRVVRNQAAKVAFGSCIMFHLIPILQVLFLREKEIRFLFLMHHKSRLRKLGIYSMINARTSIEIIAAYSF